MCGGQRVSINLVKSGPIRTPFFYCVEDQKKLNEEQLKYIKNTLQKAHQPLNNNKN